MSHGFSLLLIILDILHTSVVRCRGFCLKSKTVHIYIRGSVVLGRFAVFALLQKEFVYLTREDVFLEPSDGSITLEKILH